MTWTVIFTQDFYVWYHEQPVSLKKRLAAALINLSLWGPLLGRPLVDTVKNSRYTNMKELRMDWEGKPYRFFFAFDPQRQAVVLCGGDKSGRKHFYFDLIRKADEQFSRHLAELEKNR
jgi:hypothetical protein